MAAKMLEAKLTITQPEVTPGIVRNIAHLIGVDTANKSSIHLLSIPQALLSTPLPVGWTHCTNDLGHSVYLDRRTTLVYPDHPLLAKAQKLYRQLQDEIPPQGSEERTWMQFTRQDGTSYYYDFATEKEDIHAHPDARIQPLPESVLVEAGLVTRSPADVHKLRFYSWWHEDIESTDLTFRVNVDNTVGGGLQKRYMTLEYDLETETFTLRTTNEDQDLVMSSIISVTSKSGALVEVWDLHVGALLDVMGKTVVLMKADIDTDKWNEYHGKRLQKLKAELLQELQKYKPRQHKYGLHFERGDKKHKAGLNLRFIVNQCLEMIEDLKQYRPQKAEEYRSRIKIAM